MSDLSIIIYVDLSVKHPGSSQMVNGSTGNVLSLIWTGKFSGNPQGWWPGSQITVSKEA